MTSGDEGEEQRLALARRLREAREYVGLSQEDVAKALNLSRPAITNIESGGRKVDAIELDKLAALFRNPVSYLLTGETPIGVAPTKEVAFLARALKGLSEKDMAEVARFANFLKRSPEAKVTKKPRK